MYFYKDEAIDIIEQFDDLIIIQQLSSKRIFTIYWYDLDYFDKILGQPVSNVISLDWYRRKKKGQ